MTFLLTLWVSRRQIHLPFPAYPLPCPHPLVSFPAGLCSDVSHVLFLPLSGRAEEDHDYDLLCYPCDHLSFYHWGHICLKKVSHLWGRSGPLSLTCNCCLPRELSLGPLSWVALGIGIKVEGNKGKRCFIMRKVSEE